MFTDKTLVKEPESSAVIRFQDCDPFGHLNTARYIDYFFNARTDQVAAAYGLHIIDRETRPNESWVVNKMQIAYIYPAQLMERVIIRTRLIHTTPHTLAVEGLMLNADGARLKAVGWVDFTYVSLHTGRPTAHPGDLQEFFQLLVVEGVYDPDGFNQRVSDLRDEFRQLRAEKQAA